MKLEVAPSKKKNGSNRLLETQQASASIRFLGKEKNAVFFHWFKPDNRKPV